jgi:hypothetical protein
MFGVRGSLTGQNRTVALDCRISPKATLAGGERNRWLSMARLGDSGVSEEGVTDSAQSAVLPLILCNLA